MNIKTTATTTTTTATTDSALCEQSAAGKCAAADKKPYLFLSWGL